MVKISDCEIFLNDNNKSGIYEPGDVISGTVVLNIEERSKINSLKLHIYGSSDVEYSEFSITLTATVYKSKLEFYRHTDVLMEKKKDEELYLEAQEYKYPFIFQLPEKFPTTYTTTGFKCGTISHQVEFVIDAPWSLDKKFKKEFLVITPTYLDSKLLFPFERSDEEIDACCGKGPMINIKVIMPKTGFVPGENINLKFKSESSKEMKVSTLDFRLFQVIKLIAAGNVKEYRDLLVIDPDSNMEDNKKKGYKIEKDVVLKIPPVCPSSYDLCQNIFISYAVEVDYWINLAINKYEIPIEIGTKPLLNPADLKKTDTTLSYKGFASGKIIERDTESSFQILYPYYENIN